MTTLSQSNIMDLIKKPHFSDKENPWNQEILVSR